MFTLDPTVAFPDLGRLRYAIRARHWDGVTSLLASRPPVDRTTMVWFAGEQCARAFFEERVAAQPGDVTARALLGSTLIYEAWQVRTSYRASHVSAGQFQEFFRILRLAEGNLIEGAAHDPRDSAIWTLRVTTARGLQLGLAEARRRYDRLAAYDPHHLPAQKSLLQMLCPKWSGSFEQVHAFARDAMLAAPEGASNAALVAEGHLEHIFDLERDAEIVYRANPAVAAELREAAARSVWHPAYRPTAQWVWVHSAFALAFSLLGDLPAAASQFTALGPHYSEQPWTMLGDPLAVFQEHRNRALAAVQGVR